MFFYVSKIAWFLAAPSNLLALAILLGVVLGWSRFARVGRRLACVGVVGLFVVGLSPLASIVIAPLENRFPDWNGGAKDAPAGIIILGGAVEARVSAERGYPLELNEAGDRIMALIELARRFPSARIVSSGGSSNLAGESAAEADEIRSKIGRYGVDPARVIVENRSRTTAENATRTRALVNPKPDERWLLVTSSWHMPRAMGAFRQAGFAVEAYPVDYRTAGAASFTQIFGDVSTGLRRMDIAAKEWVGLVGYRITGRTDALFPAP